MTQVIDIYPGPDADAEDVLARAREQVLERGEGLDEADVLRVLNLPEDRIAELLGLAHEVRMRWCGPDVEVEGIVSVKTGGCPEDCHFCSQSGLFPSPVRAAWLDIPSLVEAAVQTAATGATEFCIVAAVRGPDDRLMAQMREGVAAIQAAVQINVAASLGILTAQQVDDLVDMGIHRYNHNLETARSFFPNVVTTHTWDERMDTLRLVRDSGMEVCCGGIVGLGETPGAARGVRRPAGVAEPARGAAELPQPPTRHPFEDLPVMRAHRMRCAPSAPSAWPCRGPSCATPGPRDHSGRARNARGSAGGINAVIVGNYLTTLGRSPDEDLGLLAELSMPVKALSDTL